MGSLSNIKQLLHGKWGDTIDHYWQWMNIVGTRSKVWCKLEPIPPKLAQEYSTLMMLLSTFNFWDADTLDTLMRSLTRIGDYSFKSIYKAFTNWYNNLHPPLLWKWVWSSKVWSKATFFLLVVVHDKILHGDQLMKYKWHGPFQCILYYSSIEDGSQLILHCPFAHELWCHLFNNLSTQWVTPSCLKDFVLAWPPNSSCLVSSVI